jgi:long-subunit acyl-CoA synthetase (AMP-forming)
MSETLQRLVESLGEEGPKTALLALERSSSRTWSYRELAQRSGAFARGLAKIRHYAR